MTWIQLHWKLIVALSLALAKGLQYTLGLVIVGVYASASPPIAPPKWLLYLKAALDDILPNPSLPQVRLAMRKPRVLGSSVIVPPPTVMVGTKTPVPKGYVELGLLVAIILAIACLFIPRAKADVVLSSGPSIPLLEFTGATHPVSIAPGLGYELNIGLFQFEAANQQWDALNLGMAVFGNVLSSPTGDQVGSGQVALTVGTLNNILAIGVAMSVFGVGSAAAGLPKFYPVLGLNIPISFGSTPTTSVREHEARTLPRGGTLYLGREAPVLNDRQECHERCPL